MKQREVNVLEPEYMEEFACIGGKCEDTCCAGWYISIDECTYKKYRKVKDYRLKAKIEKNVIRNRKNLSENNVAKMKLKDGVCSFLTKDKWCEIQGTLGEDYLCTTCRIYPRNNNIINNNLEKSLTISCPEAARKVLLKREPMAFNQGIKSEVLEHINSEIKLNFEKKELRDYFWELRIFIISLMQKRKYTIEERLIILGLFFDKLKIIEKENKIQDIEELIVKYEKYVEQDIFLEYIEKIPEKISNQIEFGKEIVRLGFEDRLKSNGYKECIKALVEGLELNGDNEICKKKYTEGYKKYYEPFISENPHIMENYLVNYIFKTIVPIDEEKIFESYILLILHYIVMKFHLIGMAKYNKGLNEEIIIKLFQSISKTFEHNEIYFSEVLKIMKLEGYTELANMIILIKN